MRIKLCLLLATILSMLMLFPAASASAHVLIQDTNGKAGAILHLSPDDDPVAGANTGIYYDVQTNQDLEQAALHLQITSDSGGIDESVLVSGKGHTVSGAFVFPVRGLYFMELTINSKVYGPEVKPLTFRYSVRITSSTKGNDPKPIVPAWAIFGLVMSVWGLCACVFVFIMRRHTIFRQSK